MIERDTIDWSEFRTNFPDPDTFDDPDEYAACMFRHEDLVVKFIKIDKISEDEMELLGTKLTEEWLDTVVEPYNKALYEFCKKYELALLKNHNSSRTIPMGALMQLEMLESVSDKLKRDFLDD